MNYILKIHTEDGETDVVRLHIGNIDPKKAAITVLKALETIEPPRKTRKDAGKPRQKPTSPVAGN